MPRPRLPNRVRELRQRRGWSQEQLAAQAGVSRTGVSAVESGRLIPSVATALALAGALDCRVEDLFSGTDKQGVPQWAVAPSAEPCRYWRAQVGARIVVFPVETATAELAWHDGVFRGGAFAEESAFPAEDTLLISCCDPAVGLLAAEYQRATRFRLIVIRRSSQGALELLRERLVHAAGLHLLSADKREGNVDAVRAALGSRFSLLRIARWQEGLTMAPGLTARSCAALLRQPRVRWIGREQGSGARQCLEEALAGRPVPRRTAHDHRGVVEAIRNGWADVGVCLRLPSVEAGLRYLSVREEDYDLCIPDEFSDDPRVTALIALVRSERYRRLLGELPGYDTSQTGEVQHVTPQAVKPQA